MIQKIKDERLKLRNLNNIRIAYMVQTTGIIGILGYELATEGMDGMTANPLWFVFMVTMVVSLYLHMNISVDHEGEKKDPRKGLNISLIVLVSICTIVGVLVYLTEGFGIFDGILFGGILFVCGIVPIYYIYHLRKKRVEDSEEK